MLFKEGAYFKKFVFSGLFFILLVPFSVSYAYTFQRGGEAFRTADMPIPYYVDVDKQPLNAGQWQVLHEAFQAWANAPGVNLSFVYKGLTSDIYNQNIIVVHSSGTGLGGNASVYDSLINDNYYTTGGYINVANDPTGTVLEDDPILFNAGLKSVYMHELGHVLGMGHTLAGGNNIMDAIMNFYNPSTSLTPDDIAGITVLYPAGNERPIARLIVSPIRGLPPLAVTFDASSSSDADGYIAEYVFKFSDGSPNATTTSPIISHIFILPEGVNYKSCGAGLQVTDNKGGIDFGADVPASVMVTNDLTSPPTPGGFTATPGSGRITLQWNTVTDPNGVRYNIYRSTTSGGPYSFRAMPVAMPPIGSFADTMVFAGTTYYYVISAQDGPGNESAMSAEVSATSSLGNQAPVVNAGSDQTITFPAFATLSGSASDDGLPNGTLTTLWSKLLGPGTVTFSNANSLNTTATFSQAGTYTIRLTASDSSLSTSDDLVITVNPASDTILPSIPQNLSAVAVSSSQINLSWTASTDNVGVTGYRIYRCTGSGCTSSTQISTSAVNSYSNTGLTANTTYVYRVAAYDAAGNVSNQSSSASATTQAAASTFFDGFESGTISNFTTGGNANWAVTNATKMSGTYSAKASTIGDSQNTWLRLTKTIVDGGGTVSFARSVSSETSYDFLRFYIDSVQQTSWSGIVNWSTVSYNVAAGAHTFEWRYTKDGSVTTGSDTAWIDDVTVTKVGAVAPDTTPPTISITAPISGSTVSNTITVSANASDNVGVVGVQFKLDGINLGSEDAASPYSTTWNTTATANGSHVFTAVARDAAGNQTTSFGITVTVNNAMADTQAPTVPVNLTAAAVSSSQINLTWTVSTDNVGVTGYRIYRCTGSGCTSSTQISTSAVNSYSNTGLTANTTYVYRVAAYDAAGNVSGQSSSASATTQAAQSTKFAIGDRVQVIANLQVRSTPSIYSTSLGTQKKQAKGTVVGGPQYADGYWWWNINYDKGADGWSAENYLTKITVASLGASAATNTASVLLGDGELIRYLQEQLDSAKKTLEALMQQLTQ